MCSDGGEYKSRAAVNCYCYKYKFITKLGIIRKVKVKFNSIKVIYHLLLKNRMYDLRNFKLFMLCSMLLSFELLQIWTAPFKEVYSW